MRVSAPCQRALETDSEGVFGTTADTSDLEVSRLDATNQVAAIDAVRRSIDTGIPVFLVSKYAWAQRISYSHGRSPDRADLANI
jgi:hypothetical protein